ncbi:hypothetical protein CC78DRAFT_583320 [Lojkania enalia]|uniref:Uncharacterized protein n=1 Tax=Lojkania enalia TaxID=147567 RepID=A0A9P4K4P5_9PLEO|nr:hypothetical protein CC78DRAFT_583320 [Didymosphaeria enalia]
MAMQTEFLPLLAVLYLCTSQCKEKGFSAQIRQQQRLSKELETETQKMAFKRQRAASTRNPTTVLQRQRIHHYNFIL